MKHTESHKIKCNFVERNEILEKYSRITWKLMRWTEKKMDNERISPKWDLNWFKQNNLLM